MPEPADEAGGGRLWNLSAEPELHDRLLHVAREDLLAGRDRLRELGGEEARHRDAERRLTALRRPARQTLRLLGVCRAASGMRAAASAAPSSARESAPLRGRRVLLQRSAQEAHRMIGGAAVAGAACRRRQGVERPALARGTGGQEVDRRALAARRVTRERARRGEV